MSDLIDFGVRILLGRVMALRPVVQKQGGVLVARSSAKSQVLCLGFAGRRVTVDPQTRVIRIANRRFWGFTASRRIEFDWVQCVLYGYSDLSLGWYAYQENDLFTVSLRLKNGEDVALFRFFGEGDFINNSIWPDWMYWDDMLVAKYSKGNQETESLLLADLLSRMIGVEIENPGS